MIEIEELYRRWNNGNESQKYMVLLPLLEYGYPKGALLLYNKIILGQAQLEKLIEYALNWPTGGGWSILAIEWLENGFPMNEEMSEILLLNSQNKKKYSQNERHRAQKVISKFDSMRSESID
jgi:hypothetical protein